MSNISKGGLYFESDQTLYPGEYIYIRIKRFPHSSFNGDQNLFGVEIIWHKEIQNSLFQHGYGVNFINSKDALAKIINMINAGVQRLQDSDSKFEKDPRQHPRKPYNKSFIINTQTQNYKGLVTNLSRGGAFIETKNKFSLGQIVKLIVPEGKIQKYVELKGWVVRLRQTGIGVKFDRRSNRGRRSDLDRRTGLDRRGSRINKDRIVIEY